jgi:hypothetical protein
MIRKPRAAKGKPKKPLGPREAVEAMALRLAADIMAGQRERATPAPAGSAVVLDNITGRADVPRYAARALESKRRFT